MSGYHFGRLVGFITALGMLALLAACTAPASSTMSPAAQAAVQLATVCNQIETTYNSANILYAQKKLPPSALASLAALAPEAKALCDPTHPPADMTSAITSAQQIAQQAGLAIAGVK